MNHNQSVKKIIWYFLATLGTFLSRCGEGTGARAEGEHSSWPATRLGTRPNSAIIATGPVLLVEVRDSYTTLRSKCLNDVATADIDANVANPASIGIDKEHNIARLEIGWVRDRCPIARAVLTR